MQLQLKPAKTTLIAMAVDVAWIYKKTRRYIKKTPNLLSSRISYTSIAFLSFIEETAGPMGILTYVCNRQWPCNTSINHAIIFSEVFKSLKAYKPRQLLLCYRPMASHLERDYCVIKFPPCNVIFKILLTLYIWRKDRRKDKGFKSQRKIKLEHI